MRKKTKLLSALLALVMVLSIAVMAFAANECGHDNYKDLGTTYSYPDYDSTTHVKVIHECKECQTCFEQISNTTQIVESHAASRYVFVVDYEESGETYYVYKQYCVCGYYIGQLTTQTRLH